MGAITRFSNNLTAELYQDEVSTILNKNQLKLMAIILEITKKSHTDNIEI